MARSLDMPKGAAVIVKSEWKPFEVLWVQFWGE